MDRFNNSSIGEMDLDLSFLNKVTPRSGDLLLSFRDINIEEEIIQLQNEMESIDLRCIPFDKFDFVIAFIAGLMGAACDIILGKPADGYNGVLKKAQEPNIINKYAFGLGKFLKQYDLKNNPIDERFPGIFGGNHRLYSYGHDLFRVFHTVGVMLTGTGQVKWVESLTNLGIDSTTLDIKSVIKILIILFLHLYKDYCSARSLPIPGFSYIANLNNKNMSKFLDDLTNGKEFNLRILNGQILSLVSIELIISIYSLIRKNTDNSTYSEDQHKIKKEKLILISHSIALTINAGKVVINNNPAFINFPQIIRIVTLAWSIVKSEIDINQKSFEKINMSMLKNQLETSQTLVLLDDSIYYTKYINHFISDTKSEYEDLNSKRQKNVQDGFDELDNLTGHLRSANQ